LRGEAQASIEARWAALRQAVEEAARGAGRDPASVRIIGVVKKVPAEVVRAGLAAGVTDLGENYVQEARAKRQQVTGAATWHMIGALQRNKIRVAVQLFDRIHTIASVAVAMALASEAERVGRRLPVLVQVNVAQVEGRPGVPPESVDDLGRAILGLPALAWDGLMAVPPADATGEAARPFFRLLGEVRDRAAECLGVELPHLSMGMSADFTVAVEEGATLLRLGRALFGARGPGASRPGSSAGGEGS
jgi:pyridoxal phosphate enzyme (YggS family)